MYPMCSVNGRRRFLQQAGLLALGGLFPRAIAGEPAPLLFKGILFSGIGTNGDPAGAEALKQQGIDFITGGTSPILVPDKTDEVFAANLKNLQSCPLPMPVCNGFIRPSHLRCVGEDANHDQVLEWADICFRRLKQAGGKFMVFGSGGSRALRKGWTKEQADPQFVALLKRMGPLAEKHGVTVIVEQLNTRECNYINHIKEAAELIRQANHPNVRLLADLYHMVTDGDTPEDLKAAMDVVVHVEIAEKEGRAYPGIGGQDFRPFFRVLKDAGYCGLLNIEGRGKVEQLGAAIQEIRRQEKEVCS